MAEASGKLDLAADLQARHVRSASAFPQATRDDWIALARETLRRSGYRDDVDPIEVLSTETVDRLRITPLYTRADAPPAASWVPVRSDWDVRQRFADPDPDRTNAAIRSDLANGATSVWLVVGTGGLPIAALPRALAGIRLAETPVVLDAGEDTIAAAEALDHFAADHGAQLSGTFGGDPLGTAARTGQPPALRDVAPLTKLADRHPGLRPITVDGTIYADAGAGDADELAITMSTAVSYLRALIDAGRSVNDACEQLEFRLSVTDDQFVSIAKLRGARRIWARIVQLAEGNATSARQRQHAVTSTAMLTRCDPWVNLMRGTVACFAAAAGGADAITVAPFDAALGLPDDMGRRLARNTSTILHDESHLGRVSDTACGSSYVEALTDQLAHAAWDRFTRLEAAGGAQNPDAVSSLIATAATRRRNAIARLQFPITGITSFPDLGEPLLVRAPAPSRPADGMPPHRYAEAFEMLRERADAASFPPLVFIGVLGTSSEATDRVRFAANLFHAGGIRTVVAIGDADALVRQFSAAGTSVACLYGRSGEQDVSEALRKARAVRVWRISSGPPDGRNPAPDNGIYPGCVAVAILTTTLSDLGVA